MKQVVKILICTLLLIAAAVFCIACDENDTSTEPAKTSCKHEGMEWVNDKEPTCVATGIKRAMCNLCGETFSETIPATGEHTAVTDAAVPPTCTETGLTEGSHCSVCNATLLEQQVVKENGHDYGTWIEQIDATCEATGTLGHFSCTGCGNYFDANKNQMTDLTIKKANHDYVDGYCSVCFEKKPSEGLQYTLSDDGTYYIVAGIGTCTDTEVIIPEFYQDLPVRSIGRAAFRSCSNLTSIKIPNGVTSIGYCAFQYCSSLTSVTIPEGVTRIASNAFQDCANLTSIAIPNSVTEIGEYAFSGCSKLESISVGNSLAGIEYNAFDGCRGLTGVYITDLAMWCKISYGGEKSNPLNFAKNLYLNGTLVTDLTIPDGITKINYYAFINCISITSVTIPDSVTSIGNSAFNGCSGLTSVNISDRVTTIGNMAFFGCSNLTSITIPDSVTTIGDHAFNVCTKLSAIYYRGTLAKWKEVYIGSLNTTATIYYYTETAPVEAGNYWHYVDGVPTKWA